MRKRPVRTCAAALMLALLAGSALAQPVYVCGKIYQQTPCAPDAPGRELEVPPSPSNAERRAAEARIKRDTDTVKAAAQAEQRAARAARGTTTGKASQRRPSKVAAAASAATDKRTAFVPRPPKGAASGAAK